MEAELREYLACGILAHGFVRARCNALTDSLQPRFGPAAPERIERGPWRCMDPRSGTTSFHDEFIASRARGTSHSSTSKH